MFLLPGAWEASVWDNLPLVGFARMLRRVPTVFRTLALALAVIWLPVSSHALLEHWEIIHHEHSHAHHPHTDADAPDHDADHGGPHEHGTMNHDVADGICLTLSAKVSVPRPVAVQADGPMLLLLLLCAEAERIAERHAGLSPPGAAPPQLYSSWQFSLRTALPARAPSVVC